MAKDRSSKTGSANRPDALGPVMRRRVARHGPADQAQGRWLGDFGTLSDAERKLVDKCAAGKICWFDDECPKVGTPKNMIRAELVRFLILGGDQKHPVHELGVWLKGAWVHGKLLDLECVRSSVFVALLRCHISCLMRASDAELPGLNLEGSLLHGLDAARLKVKGAVFLRRGFSSKAEVRLDGAEIGGNLDCDGSDFCDVPIASDVGLGAARSPEQVPAALRAEGIVVKGDVLLGKARLEEALPEKAFSADGEVWLTGANINGKLSCSGGKFSAQGVIHKGDNAWEEAAALRADLLIVKGDVLLDKCFLAEGEVRLTGSQIEGSLHCSGGRFSEMRCRHALDAQRMTVKGKFDARGTFDRRVNLSGARIGSFVDIARSWRRASLQLDGLHYDRISDSSTNPEERVQWLAKQIPRHLRRDFRPQPWEQLIKVLRDMGHPEEATEVAIEKQRRRGKSRQMNGLRLCIHNLYDIFAVYGYRPTRTLVWVIGVMIYSALAFAIGEQQGLLGPVAPAIQLSTDLKICEGGGKPGAIRWTSAECPMPAEYSSFQPLLYSADLILPFVDLQQEKDWSPIIEKGRSRWILNGEALRIVMWFDIIFGWLMSLLLLAALGRVLNKD
jgi:hypothetical protein